MKVDISFDFDITFTNFFGAVIILAGVACIFVKPDQVLAIISIGAGLMGIAKAANTSYDNAHKE